MGTYIIATLLFLALAYALYKIFSKRGKCCGNCGCCGNDSDGCKPFSTVCRFFCYGACRRQPLPSHSIQPC